jgi:Toprim-like
VLGDKTMHDHIQSRFNTDLPNKIRSNLKRDNPKYHETETHINGLTCPSCGKVEAFSYLGKPFAIICHRNNECGVNTPVKQVYPELWQDLAKQYPPTPTDKKATARAYLESRGLNPDCIEFNQGHVNGHQTLIIEQNGVKFQRLIDYTGDDKARLTPYKGRIFETATAKDSDTVFVVEAVLNALSFKQSGHAAIATYSSGAIPKNYYQENSGKTYILAFDNDKAGIKGIKKTIEFFKELGITNYRIALPPKGKDWNDLLQTGQLAAETLDKTLDKAYWLGKLAFAESALNYFNTYRERYPAKKSLIFEFSGWIEKGYMAKLKGDDYEPRIKPLCDCIIRLLHSVIDDSQDDKQRMQHYLELYSKREGKGRLRLDATEIVSIDKFKTALQHHRQLFFGNGDDLTALTLYLFDQQPKTPKIRALSVIGYDDKSEGFYFAKFMYDKAGKRINANSEKYFTDANIKPFMDCSDAITSRLDEIDIQQFIIHLHAAYGFKGLLALGFYVASLFSHLIFEHYNFFPFLSLYGHAHVGKSYMSRLLNRCFFVDSEGNTMTSANTAKGELRKISQKSSLVCALLEGRDGKSRFDFDSILPLYNRNTLYSRAATSQDNRTHDLPLKAALSFVWNHECFTLKAAKERVVSLHFSEDELNEDTGKAWTQLNTYSPEQLAGVGHYVLTNRKYFEDELVKITKDSADILKGQGIAVTRIAENHAIALAGISALMELLKMNDISFDDLTKYALKRALHKVDTAKTESHLADYFFASISEFNTAHGVGTNSDNELVVHLPTVLTELQSRGNGFTNKSELIAELKTHDRYVTVKNSRAIGGVQRECYHFKT